MRIYLKTISSESGISYQDAGFIAFRSKLQQKSPQIGLSVEVDEAGVITSAPYLYALNEEGMTIKRYPLRRLCKLVSVVEPYTRSETITGSFTSFDETAVPTVPDDADTYFFSIDEKMAMLSLIRDCFATASNVFHDNDPQLLKSILRTLFSAGFVTHASWQETHALLIKHQNKLKEIASALFALHEAGILTQKIFTVVVNHAQPSKCAVALLQLFDKYVDLRQIPFKKVGQLDDEIIFPTLRPEIKKLYEDFVTTVVAHPFPLEVSKIIVFLHHSFGQQQKFNSDILVAITKMTDGPTLHRVGPILYHMPKQLITNENCLALLKSSHSKLQNITNTMRYLLKPNSKAALTQPLLDCLIAYDDPQVLMAALSKYSKRADPAALVAVFLHLVKAGIGTDKNLNAFCKHKNLQALEGLFNEVITAGVTITQPIFDALCAYAEITYDAFIIESKKEAIWEQFKRSQVRLFPLRVARGVSMEGERKHSEAVKSVLQQVVFGNEHTKEDSVKTALEAAKTDLEKLSTLLCDISTVTNDSGCKTTDTLLKAALRAGDVEMCNMLKPYFDLIPGGKVEFEIQFLEVFPDGPDARYQELEADSKRDFEPMLQAAKDAILAEQSPDPSNRDDPNNNLNATLNKQKDSVLYQALENVFRKPFEALSHREKTFNPYHLLRVYEVYNELCDQCERDGSDPLCKKRDLFWRQIIGYTQRFVPACYAQAFVQGLWDLVWVDGFQSSNWQAKALERSIKLKYDPGSYFTSSSYSGVPLVLGVDFAICGFVRASGGHEGGRACVLHCFYFQKLLSSKNSKLSEHYAAGAGAVPRPVG